MLGLISTGSVASRRNKKLSSEYILLAIRKISNKLMSWGIKKVILRIEGSIKFNFVFSIIKGLKKLGIKTLGAHFITKIPFNGCKICKKSNK